VNPTIRKLSAPTDPGWGCPKQGGGSETQLNTKPEQESLHSFISSWQDALQHMSVRSNPPALLDRDPSILAESPSCLLVLLRLSSPPSHGIPCSHSHPSPQPLISVLRFKRSPPLSQPATIVFARALSPRTTALGAARRLASSHGAAAGAASNVCAAPQRAGGVRSCSGRRRFQQAGNTSSSMNRGHDNRQFWHVSPNDFSGGSEFGSFEPS
jgi:hypothetical protein